MASPRGVPTSRPDRRRCREWPGRKRDTGSGSDNPERIHPGLKLGGLLMIATLWFAYVFIYKGPRP